MEKVICHTLYFRWTSHKAKGICYTSLGQNVFNSQNGKSNWKLRANGEERNVTKIMFCEQMIPRFKATSNKIYKSRNEEIGQVPKTIGFRAD